MSLTTGGLKLGMKCILTKVTEEKKSLGRPELQQTLILKKVFSFVVGLHYFYHFTHYLSSPAPVVRFELSSKAS